MAIEVKGNKVLVNGIELGELLNTNFSLCGEYVRNVETDQQWDSEAGMSYETLRDAIDGWYSDGETWLLSVATTTRKQPLYGISSIIDGWEDAARNSGETFTESYDDEDIEYSASEVYGELIRGANWCFTSLGTNPDEVTEAIERFEDEAKGVISCSSGVVTLYYDGEE